MMATIEVESPVVPEIIFEEDEIGKILEKAADIIEERGHGKGRLGSYTSSEVCLWGAINVAIHGSWTWAEKTGVLFDNIEKRLGFKANQADVESVQWNNHHERTKEEVILRLREASAGSL